MISKLFNDLANFFLPETCCLCRAPGKPLCFKCSQNLLSSQKLKMSGPEPIGNIFACSSHAGLHRAALLSYKLDFNRVAGKVIGNCMISAVRADRFDVIVAVPADGGRKKERGFDPAEELAQLISEGLGLPLVNALYKISGGKDQTELNWKQRFDNVSGMFKALHEHEPEIAGKRVLLVDDVVTTGATMAECALEIKAMKAREITGIVFTASEVLVKGKRYKGKG